MNIYQVNRFARYSILHLFLLSVAFTCVFPLYWMFRCSLMSLDAVFTDMSFWPKAVNWQNYAEVWKGANFGVFFLNSVLYTVCVVVGIVLVSSLAAFAFSRLKFPGRRFLFGIFVASIMIPLPVSFVPLVVMMNKIGLANTRIGYIFCMINVGLVLSVMLLKTFFDKMTPDLEDAARIDGCNKLQIWWHVALPLARPAIAVVIIFNSLSVWNEFILANLLLTDDSLMTLQTGLYRFQGPHLANYPVLMAGLTISVVPIIIIYLFMQKHIIKGLSSGDIVG
jgi:raffinose/stachyose/melibiose transport system permease protein